MQTPYFTTRPISRSQLPDFNMRSCLSVEECLGTSNLYRDGRLIQKWLDDQLVPIDFYDTLICILSSRYEVYVVSELVDSESAQTLLAERKTLMLCRSP